MAILVVGGAGYIGSHCTRTLIQRGYNVVVIDNLSTGFRQAVDKRARLYVGDIRDESFLVSVFQKETIEGVIFLASNSLVGESVTNPLKYFDNNVHGAEVLLRTMLTYHIKLMVFSSSAAVYGEPVSIPIDENSATVPTNPYGETKLAIEKMLKWVEKAFQLKYVSLRYFNVAGADSSAEIGEAHQPETHLIPIVLQVPLGKRKFVSVFGNDYPTKDGTCIRDYIHIEDLVEAHLLALKHLLQGGPSDVFNLGSEHGYSVKEIIEEVQKVTNQKIPYEIWERRAGDPAILVASNQKAREMLRWNPKHTSVRSIIQSAWNFHRKYPNGYPGDK